MVFCPWMYCHHFGLRVRLVTGLPGDVVHSDGWSCLWIDSQPAWGAVVVSPWLKGMTART